MAKHLSFWIGFFVAFLISTPIALGVWGVFQDHAFETISVVFGAICTLVFFLVIILFFRDSILKKVMGTTEASVDDIVHRLVGLANCIMDGDRKGAVTVTEELGRTFTSWYAWTGLYRWVMKTAFGLLFALGAFAGTILLFEQIKRLSEQNDIISYQSEFLTVNLVGELRRQILSTSDTIKLIDYLPKTGFMRDQGIFLESSSESCALSMNTESELKTLTSEGTISAIADLAKNHQHSKDITNKLSKDITKALRFLVDDNNSVVALGAFLVLDKLGKAKDINLKTISGLLLDKREINTPINLRFTNSVVSELTCPNCKLNFYNSMTGVDADANISLHRSIIFEDSSSSALSLDLNSSYIGLSYLHDNAELPESATLLKASSSSVKAFILSSDNNEDGSNLDQCDQLRSFSEEAALWNFIIPVDNTLK